MKTQEPFDRSYLTDADSTSAPAPKSTIKQFQKLSIEEEELKRYGSSKPIRIVIRAKLIHGKGKNY